MSEFSEMEATIPQHEQSEIKTNNEVQQTNELTQIKQSISQLLTDINILQSIPKQSEEEQPKKENQAIKEKEKDIINILEKSIQSATDEYATILQTSLKKFEENTTAYFSQKEYLLAKSTEQEDPPVPFCQEKSFRNSESALTILFKNQNHFRTLYNLALVTMIFLFISLIMQDYIQNLEFSDLENLIEIFQGFIDGLYYWLNVVFMSLSVIVLVQLSKYYPQYRKIWIGIYVFFHYFILYYSLRMIKKNKLQFGSAMALSSETTRIVMKMHSYFRHKLLYGTDNEYKEYLPKACKAKNMTIEDLNQPVTVIENAITELKRYIHFFFLPTLMYRDSYKLKPTKNWRFILGNFMNFLFCIYFSYMITKACIFQEKDKFVIRYLNLWEASELCLKCIFPAVIWLMLMFFGFLHSWLNMFAELLGFQDRVFYLDWWNSSEFGSYYRKWNIVVHDWLYQHIYCDLIRFSKDKLTRSQAQVITFLYSALIHEVIITTAIGYFFPLLFIIFTGPGIILIQNKRFNNLKQFNIVFWFLFCFGAGLIITFYFREYYIRQIISDELMKQKFGILEFLVPRSIAYQFCDL